MYCPYCGNKNDSRNHFCMFCSAELISEKSLPKGKRDRAGIILISAITVALLILVFLVFMLLSSDGMVNRNKGTESIHNENVAVTVSAPSLLPTAIPTVVPTLAPTPPPTTVPTTVPTPVPAPVPTSAPTESPKANYILPDSDKRYLNNSDLAQLSHRELCLARNEIFARHGRQFKNGEIAAYFSEQSWYSGTISPEYFDSGVFNDFENSNIALIQQYEELYFGGSYY